MSELLTETLKAMNEVMLAGIEAGKAVGGHESERLRQRIETLESVLSTVHDYLLPFVDVKDGDNGPKPNRAMNLVEQINQVLGKQS